MTEQAPASNVTADDTDEISLLDLLQVIADNLRLLILGPLAVGLAALGISFLITPTFTATTVFLPPQQQQSAAASMLQSLGALGGLAGAAGIKSLVDQYVAMAGSRTVEDALIDRFDLVNRYEKKFKQDTRKMLEGATKISSSKAGLITVEVDDRDPKFAAELANAYVEELSKLMGHLALTEAQQRRTFFERQLSKAKDGLAKAEISLKATGISESVIKANPVAAVGSVATLMAQVAAKEVQLGSMRNYLSDSAPEFKQAQSELAALRNQLARADTNGASTQGAGDYVAKFREFKYYETLFELLAKQYEIARLDESREDAVIQVVDQAIPPELKSKPKKAQIAVIFSLVTGFILLIFIFARQAFRNILSDPDDMEKIGRLRSSILRSLGRI